MLQVYCGDGKGKTTAAFGLAARAAGGGYRVVIVQFLKGRSSGEVDMIASLPGVTLLKADIPDVFSWQMTTEQREQVLAVHNDLFQRAAGCCDGGKTMVVFDELLGALSEKLVDTETVLSTLRSLHMHENIELVITGRNPPKELLQMADYVTEMKKIKHPFDNGAQMRKGIEY